MNSGQDLEKRLEKKLKDVKRFNNSYINIKEKITYFKHKNGKSNKKFKTYRTLNRMLKSLESIVVNCATSISIGLSITGFVLVIFPISASKACGLSLGNKLLYEIVDKIYSRYKKQNQEDQQTSKSFDNLYRKFLQDNVSNKKEYESLFL